MSTKPGVTSRPLASISSAAPPDTLPTVAILPSFTAMSASRRVAPVPSASVPPRTTRSKSFAMSLLPEGRKLNAKASRAHADRRTKRIVVRPLRDRCVVIEHHAADGAPAAALPPPTPIGVAVGARAASVKGHHADDKAQVVPPTAVGIGVDADVEEQTGDQREQRNVALHQPQEEPRQIAARRRRLMSA